MVDLFLFGMLVLRTNGFGLGGFSAMVKYCWLDVGVRLWLALLHVGSVLVCVFRNIVVGLVSCGWVA